MKISKTERRILDKAAQIREKYCNYDDGVKFSNCDVAMNIFKNRFFGLEAEEFHVAFLDSQNCLIKCEKMFSGTINSASVYPREIAKRALELNASAIVLAHNHPSGLSRPSRPDDEITDQIVSALDLLDVRVLDHIIVGKTNFSYAQHGKI